MSADVNPELRTARPADAAAIAVLQEGIYREGRWFVGDTAPSEPAIRQRLHGLHPAQSLYLVATAGKQAVAWLELNRLQPERMQHVALLTLAVDASWRRKGLGRQLLHRSYEWCTRVGVRKITLNVRARNTA